MLSRSLLVVSALVATAWSQTTLEATATDDTTATPEETATTTATGIPTHTINVGASGHKFTPSELEAQVGDIIEWRFYPTEHWVIRGDFENPCIPYEYVDTDRRGFSSGPQKVQAITDDAPRYRVRVNNTDPIYFYCGAPGSCSRYHMMGVVNPTSNATLEEWQEKAEEVDYQLRPGDPWPTEEDYPEETGSKNKDSSDSGSGSGSGNSGIHLSPGAIAGIAIGAAGVLILGAGLIYLCGRRGGFDKAYRKSFRSSAPVVPPTIVENQYNTPGATEAWSPGKHSSPMASAYAQSPPLSPHHTSMYGHPGMAQASLQDGNTGSYYSDNYPQQNTASPMYVAESPRPREQAAPAELPASTDPGNSPLPTYNTELPRTFSWAGEETGYRPSK